MLHTLLPSEERGVRDSVVMVSITNLTSYCHTVKNMMADSSQTRILDD